MEDFRSGEQVRVRGDSPCTIIDKLGEGGQGAVYRVSWMGGEYALKWYKTPPNNPDAFYDNLKNNIEKGSPSDAFL